MDLFILIECCSNLYQHYVVLVLVSIFRTVELTVVSNTTICKLVFSRQSWNLQPYINELKVWENSPAAHLTGEMFWGPDQGCGDKASGELKSGGSAQPSRPSHWALMSSWGWADLEGRSRGRELSNSGRDLEQKLRNIGAQFVAKHQSPAEQSGERSRRYRVSESYSDAGRQQSQHSTFWLHFGQPGLRPWTRLP